MDKKLIGVMMLQEVGVMIMFMKSYEIKWIPYTLSALNYSYYIAARQMHQNL